MENWQSGLQIRHHSTVELVDRLATHGYVERQKGENDRREVLLTLTPKGERVLRELSLHHRAELRKEGPALFESSPASDAFDREHEWAGAQACLTETENRLGMSDQNGDQPLPAELAMRIHNS